MPQGIWGAVDFSLSSYARGFIVSKKSKKSTAPYMLWGIIWPICDFFRFVIFLNGHNFFVLEYFFSQISYLGSLVLREIEGIKKFCEYAKIDHEKEFRQGGRKKARKSQFSSEI